ncbi:MAG: isoaspartyl peptidase/L-asparaginase [Flavobacteriales bacterium]|nr:isoaspartyl peptidase/L-asparaginase [Flavobacteriales bacterium]
MQKISLAIHGGAGTIIKNKMNPSLEKKYLKGLKDAVNEGYKLLKSGSSSTDAVQSAVENLENNPLFNAGKGAVFSANGKHEMDAAIMEGKSLNAGGVCGVSSVKNPISLARLVMDKSEHVLLSGKGAEDFASLMNCKTENEKYFYDEFRHDQWQRIKDTDKFQLDHSPKKTDKFGTVGAVALDSFGNLAAATSTGGMTNKKFGRVGDSPIIGAGNYANNKTCAISCTGSGEFFLRGVVAYDVSCLMEMRGLSLEAACKEVIQKRIKLIGGDGGLIAVDNKGNIAMPFNTEGMYRASIDFTGKEIIEIY